MNSKKLIRKLFKKFPTKIAKKYHDYVGVMVNCLKEDIKKIVLCLDVTPTVCEKAIEIKSDLIISHHPFFYGKKKFILENDELKRSMYDKLLDNHIAVYSFHTNFDEADDGMNDALARLLNLKNIHPLPFLPMARCGELETELNIYDFAKIAISKLNLKYGQLIAKGKKSIKKVAIIGGGGSRDALIALKDADIYLSGDTPYHIRRAINDLHLNYLHIDHEVEKIFCEQMKKILLTFDNNLDIEIVDDVEQSELIVL